MKINDIAQKRSLTYYYLIIIGIISSIFIIQRIILYFININDFPADSFIALLFNGRDADFKLVKFLMEKGLIGMYEEGMPYLYYSYFIFFPMYILPTEIGVYVSDCLRLIAVIYIAKNINKLTEDKWDILLFYILSIIGYTADMSLNNSNGVILLFLFLSFIQFKKDRKFLSGFLFSLAAYKILVLIFPFTLLLVRKIKWKDLVYFFTPLIILCIPYIIFPGYTLLMVQNMSGRESVNIIIDLLVLTWQISQTAQLLFMSFIGLVMYLDFDQLKKFGKYKTQFRFLIFIFLFFVYTIYEVINISIGFYLKQLGYL